MMKVHSYSLALVLLAGPLAALQEKPTPEKTDPSKAYQSSQEKPAQAAKPDQQQAAASGDKSGTFSNDQLEQIVAPIALYPDSLLSQILMASTYPLEVVEAARWLGRYPDIKPDKLETELQKMEWDPSVKSLCGFKDVLKRMNDNLDWTQDLGDAFLADKAKVMEAVQAMRRKALDSGTLKSSKELTVKEESDKIIVIQAANPEVVYVPTYYPSTCYGSWHYPYWYYPPMYYPPPAGAAWFGFSVGVVWGAAIWGDCDWNNNDIDIDIDKQNNFIDRTENGGRREEVKDKARSSDRAGNKSGKGGWSHNSEHRKGVGYKDSKTAQKFGASPGQSRVSRDQARGFSDKSSARPTTGNRATTPSAGTRDQSSSRAGTSSRPSTSNRSSSTPSSRSSATTGQRSSSFSGSGSAGFDRASSSRGSSSRGSMGSRGGGSRGGGGRGGRR